MTIQSCINCQSPLPDTDDAVCDRCRREESEGDKPKPMGPAIDEPGVVLQYIMQCHELDGESAASVIDRLREMIENPNFENVRFMSDDDFECATTWIVANRLETGQEVEERVRRHKAALRGWKTRRKKRE